ncbi:unnamed protein product [Rangifer tarandus platyrhynchus]|uniref:Uncharacterized protein n=1 Tax=Rangifer tarandus platyrhynchus TaxID=3082113 RepID=A0ABN8YAI2_RANTA|nr:unnamed protein product [Rangifer tarandus platyrhynchus]
MEPSSQNPHLPPTPGSPAARPLLVPGPAWPRAAEATAGAGAQGRRALIGPKLAARTRARHGASNPEAGEPTRPPARCARRRDVPHLLRLWGLTLN